MRANHKLRSFGYFIRKEKKKFYLFENKLTRFEKRRSEQKKNATDFVGN
jgi:hypothetical protein